MTRPAAGKPALITFDDANTMFHEFGHALVDKIKKAAKFNQRYAPGEVGEAATLDMN